LEGVQGGALSEIIGNYPEGQPVVDGWVASDAPHVNVIGAGQVQRHGVGVAEDGDARHFVEELGRLSGVHGTFELQVDRLAMAGVDGHADAGGGDSHVGIVENLPRFVDHLLLFLGVAVIEKIVDVGEEVEGEGVGHGVCACGGAGQDGLGLVCQFLDRARAGPGGGLVGVYDDAADGVCAVEGIEGHDHLDGGAVGGGDDALMVLHVLAVDFGHDEGDGGVHAIGGALVDGHSAFVDGDGGEAAAYRRTGGDEGKVDVSKGVFRGLLDLVFLTGDGDSCAGGAFGGEQLEMVDGEGALFQDSQEFTTHDARGAYYCYVEISAQLLFAIFLKFCPSLAQGPLC